MNTIKKILLYLKLAFYTKTGIILTTLFTTIEQTSQSMERRR
jgi:hypothetical protein